MQRNDDKLQLAVVQKNRRCFFLLNSSIILRTEWGTRGGTRVMQHISYALIPNLTDEQNMFRMKRYHHLISSRKSGWKVLHKLKYISVTIMITINDKSDENN